MNRATGMPAKPLRIAYVVQQYPVPTQTFAQSDIAALQDAGHTVDVFTMKPGGGDAPANRMDRPSLRTLAGLVPGRGMLALTGWLLRHGWHRPRLLATALVCLPRADQIARYITRGDYDVVHLFWARHTALVPALLAARGAPVRRSVFVGAYDLVADDMLVELAFRHAEVLFTHAEANRPYLASRAREGQRVEVVHRGIPLPDLPDDRRIQTRWASAGALVREKGIDSVIRAFARNRGANDTLHIYGDGPQRSDLEALAAGLGVADVVTFHGHVSREALFDRLAEAGLFLLLSTKPSERLPNVVKEALWAGCAVIASDTPGIGELLPDRRIGHVVDPADNGAIDTAIGALVAQDAATAAANRALAREHVARRFSAKAAMARYAAVWNDA